MRPALQAGGSEDDSLGPTRANRAHNVCWLVGPVGPDPKGGATGPTNNVSAIRLLLMEVEGIPQPEPRPRFDPRSKRTYVPTNAHEWKREIRKQVRAELLRAGVTQVVPTVGRAFAVGLLFRFQRPRSHYRAGRFAHLLKASAPVDHTSKPDLDNLIKAAIDALGDWDRKPALIWADDSQVTRYFGTPMKRYCLEGETAGLTLVIAPC